MFCRVFGRVVNFQSGVDKNTNGYENRYAFAKSGVPYVEHLSFVKHLLNILLLILGHYVAFLVYSILGSENEYASLE